MVSLLAVPVVGPCLERVSSLSSSYLLLTFCRIFHSDQLLQLLRRSSHLDHVDLKQFHHPNPCQAWMSFALCPSRPGPDSSLSRENVWGGEYRIDTLRLTHRPDTDFEGYFVVAGSRFGCERIVCICCKDRSGVGARVAARGRIPFYTGAGMARGGY